MKKLKTLFILVIIVFVAIIGSIIIACDFPYYDVTISGTPKVGSQITAMSTGNFIGDFTWQFSWSNNPFSWVEYWEDGSSEPYKAVNTIQKIREGMWIRAFRINGNGVTVYSNILGPIQPAGL